jgi:hypothetical protein
MQTGKVAVKDSPTGRALTARKITQSPADQGGAAASCGPSKRLDLEPHRAEIAAMCRRLGVKELDVFGSALRDDFDPKTSDVDFLVELPAQDAETYFDTWFDLKEQLERITGRKVDLITPEMLTNPYLKKRVLESRERIYAS